MATFDPMNFKPFDSFYPIQQTGCSPPFHKTPDYIRQQHRIRMVLNDLNLLEDTMLLYGTEHGIDASKTPFRRLKRINLQDLHMGEVTKGGYLLLRTIEPAYKMGAINTIVEDHEGNAVLFALYNFAPEVDILPIGTIFVLKEPYIKMSRSKGCLLRCDCPTDVTILHEGHELFNLTERITWKNTPNPDPVNPVSRNPKPKTAMEWKVRGNSLFEKGRYDYATQCYLLGSREAEKMNNDEDLLVMRLNLSAVYLKRGFFETSLDYAKLVLGFDPGNPKALLRAARCCYQLRKYKVAKRYFEVLNKLCPDYEDGIKEFNECKNRVLEQETGEFNMHKMFLHKLLNRGKTIDCADYVGPVKVVEIAGKGRGVVATKDLHPGTLVTVSKALAFSWNETGIVYWQTVADQTTHFSNDIILTTKVSQAIAKNPNTFGPIIYDLFDGQPNANSKNNQLFCDTETKEEPIADIRKIKKILDMNCFMSSYNQYQVDDSNMEEFNPFGSGLFAFPSYFNHSCLSNADWLMFNDVIFIRVTQFTKAGQEVSIPYFPCETMYKIRDLNCKIRGFQCTCSLCHFERNEQQHQKIERCNQMVTLHTQIEPHLMLGNVSVALIKRFKKLIRAVEMTYENDQVPPPKLDKLPFYHFLAKAYKIKGNIKEQIRSFQKFIREFGFNTQQLLTSLEDGETFELPKNAILCPVVLRYFEMVIHAYDEHGDTENMKKWMKLLVDMEKLYSGGDINVVKLKYCRIPWDDNNTRTLILSVN